MSRISLAFWVLVLAGCNQLGGGKSELHVKTLDGVPALITVDSKTLVIGVASWCPHTKSFIRTITDSRVTPSLRDYVWVFVFSENEWPSVKSQLEELQKSGKLGGRSVESTLATLKAKAGDGPLFDPRFLDTLPGKFYFVSKGAEYGLDSYPSLYSRKSGSFDADSMEWLESQSKGSKDIYDSYEKGKQAS